MTFWLNNGREEKVGKGMSEREGLFMVSICFRVGSRLVADMESWFCLLMLLMIFREV